MMRLTIFLIGLIFSTTVYAQNSIAVMLKKLNNETVPYIKVSELKGKNNIVFLDARELKEYKVSHIQHAVAVGFDHFKATTVTRIVKDKNAKIVVYCSIGVRSEKIGERLLQLGYKNVYNLYGGIFEYKNLGGKVVNNYNKVTDSVHAFNKKWSVYLTRGIKVYEN